jgi:hypothetical protein
MVMCASAKSRSLQAFNRFHSSIAFSRGCLGNHQRSFVLPNVWFACIGKIPEDAQEKT